MLLHDLGLTPRFHSSSARFEVASANAARSFARESSSERSAVSAELAGDYPTHSLIMHGG